MGAKDILQARSHRPVRMCCSYLLLRINKSNSMTPFFVRRSIFPPKVMRVPKCPVYSDHGSSWTLVSVAWLDQDLWKNLVMDGFFKREGLFSLFILMTSYDWFSLGDVLGMKITMSFPGHLSSHMATSCKARPGRPPRWARETAAFAAGRMRSLVTVGGGAFHYIILLMEEIPNNHLGWC